MRILAVLALIATPAAAQEVNMNVYYRLSTELLGPEMPLGLKVGGDLDKAAEVEPLENVSSQFWRFHPAPFGRVRISTMFLGPQMCLDVVQEGDRKNEVELRVCGDWPGQRWKIEVEENGFRLTNQVNGTTECLGAIDSGPAKNRLNISECGFYGTQFWDLTSTEQPVQ